MSKLLKKIKEANKSFEDHYAGKVKLKSYTTFPTTPIDLKTKELIPVAKLLTRKCIPESQSYVDNLTEKNEISEVIYAIGMAHLNDFINKILLDEIQNGFPVTRAEKAKLDAAKKTKKKAVTKKVTKKKS